MLLDGAQAVSHLRVDVQALGCDFFVFSGHKVFAPTGIGVVFGRSELLDAMPPWQGGGNMIEDVTFERTMYQRAPARFEAGTGNIADAVGLGAALDYVDAHRPREHRALRARAARSTPTAGLATVPGLRLIGTAPEKAGVLSFVLEGQRTEEVGTALNRRASPCAPATTARNRSCAASASRPRYDLRSPSTTPAPKLTSWCAHCIASRIRSGG